MQLRLLLPSIHRLSWRVRLFWSDDRFRPKDIAAELNLSERSVSSQLGKLSQLELVESIQSGRHAYYWVRQIDLLPILQERSNILLNYQGKNA